MEYMSSGAYPEYKIINALCSIYNPDDVMQSFNYSLGVKGTIYKHKKKLKEYICRLKNGKIEFYSKAFLIRKHITTVKKLKGIERIINISQLQQFIDILKRLMSLLVIETEI